MDLLKKIRRRFYTAFYEKRLGVATDAAIPVANLDYRHVDTKPYHPIGYEALLWSLRRIPFPAKDVEFVDIGCGMGRVICAAAALPYRSVTGVELSPSMCESARRNLANMKGKQARATAVFEGDATLYPISPTANVFFFFNPFGGETLRKVIHNIGASLAEHPRPAFIIYFNHNHADPILTKENWIKKTFDGEFYPQVTCGLYETVPAKALASAGGRQGLSQRAVER